MTSLLLQWMPVTWTTRQLWKTWYHKRKEHLVLVTLFCPCGLNRRQGWWVHMWKQVTYILYYILRGKKIMVWYKFWHTHNILQWKMCGLFKCTINTTTLNLSKLAEVQINTNLQHLFMVVRIKVISLLKHVPSKPHNVSMILLQQFYIV